MAILANFRDILVDNRRFMQQLSHLLRKTLSKKKLSTAWYMGVILHTIGDVLWVSLEHGVIKYGVVYVKITDHWKKMTLFHEKKSTLEKVNKILAEYGYSVTVKDIRS